MSQDGVDIRHYRYLIDRLEEDWSKQKPAKIDPRNTDLPDYDYPTLRQFLTNALKINSQLDRTLEKIDNTRSSSEASQIRFKSLQLKGSVLETMTYCNNAIPCALAKEHGLLLLSPPKLKEPVFDAISLSHNDVSLVHPKEKDEDESKDLISNDDDKEDHDSENLISTPPLSPTTRNNNEEPETEKKPEGFLNNSNKSPKARKDSQNVTSLLQHHRDTQDDLTNELGQMARQLKLNSVHLSTSLQADKSVLEQVDESLQKNFDRTSSQTGQLKTYAATSTSSTWFVILAVLGISIAWMFMFFIIRIT